MIPILTADKPQTARVLRVLQAIDAFWRENGYAPANREIAKAAGYSVKGASASVVSAVNSLRTAGLIQDVPNTARTIRLTARGKEALG